jgi:hypothetical protein
MIDAAKVVFYIAKATQEPSQPVRSKNMEAYLSNP